MNGFFAGATDVFGDLSIDNNLTLCLHRKLDWVQYRVYAVNMSSVADKALPVAARKPLNRQRILQAAIELADREGIDSLSMRRLGGELGVEAMALYRHVANKEELLDGMVDLVISEIDPPAAGDDWRHV